MTIERIRYGCNTYFFNPEKEDFYCFDKVDVCHVIVYTLRDYGAVEYTAQWRIPGTNDKDIFYARRMAAKLPPWNIEMQGAVPINFGGLIESKRL